MGEVWNGQVWHNKSATFWRAIVRAEASFVGVISLALGMCVRLMPAHFALRGPGQWGRLQYVCRSVSKPRQK